MPMQFSISGYVGILFEPVIHVINLIVQFIQKNFGQLNSHLAGFVSGDD
jgi:hypothetical protein